MADIRLDKKVMVPAGVSAAVIFGLAFIYPLLGKIQAVRSEWEAVDQKLENARRMIRLGEKIPAQGRLLKREEISLAIDEITKKGKAVNINFISMIPQKIGPAQAPGYQQLPIRMELESEYKNLGMFIHALGDMEEAVAIVHQFKLSRDEETPSLVKADMTINLLLKGAHE